MVNAVFAPPGACVLEVSTYSSDPPSAKLWRSNRDAIVRWNPSLNWEVYRVPLAEMLRHNRRTDLSASLPWAAEVRPSRDFEILNLPRVPMTEAHAAEIGARMQRCLLNRKKR